MIPEGFEKLSIPEQIGYFYDKPLEFVYFAFPWGEGQLAKHKPAAWQIDVLKEIGRQVKENKFDGKTKVPAIRVAVSSGHGIGKSVFVAWLILWIMTTRPYCKGSITAGTAQQLNTKTWPELFKWYSMFIFKDMFKCNMGQGNMYIAQIENEPTWRANAITCRKEESQSFQGQHAANSTSFYIFDEASAIYDEIWSAAEGGLTDGEPMFFVFGNPNKNTGWFRECFRKFKHRWFTKTVDSRTVDIAGKDQIQEWLEDWGEDSDFFKTRVRGLFPSSSDYQFISEKIVDAAYGRSLDESQFNFAPSIIGVDPAWTGSDDLVIVHRKGLFSEILNVIKKNDNDILIANIIANHEDRLNADAVFIDMGFGTGIHSAGISAGRAWTLVHFGQKSLEVGFYNQRAYMWAKMKKWLMEGGAIPEDEQLRYDLTSIEYQASGMGVLQLPSKDTMKKSGIPSPDRADALALTFAMPVLKNLGGSGSGGNFVTDFDILDGILD